MPIDETLRHRINSFLIEGMKLKQKGFTDIVEFVDHSIGFSFRKRTTDAPAHSSLFHILISGVDLAKSELVRKPFIITAVYGRETGNGIAVRGEDSDWLHEPLDINFFDEFFYDINQNQIYKRDRQVTPEQVLDEVYEKHMRTTRPIRGFILRLRLFFWRLCLPPILSLIAGAFRDVLFLVSGDRYYYDFILQEEILNDNSINSRNPERAELAKRRFERIRSHDYGYGSDKPPKEIDLFGILKVRPHPAIFYAVTQILLLVYLLSHYGVEIKSVEDFFGNNFFIVIYAIVSYTTVEGLLPWLLRKATKLFLIWAGLSKYGNLKV